MKTEKDNARFHEVCLANRQIELVESVSGKVNQYLAIEKVEGVGVYPIVGVGESSLETRQTVRKCGRCVGSRRKCDLSTKTINDLNPQS